MTVALNAPDCHKRVMQENDAELIALGRKLDEARRVYDAMVEAIPDDVSADAEAAAIEAASGPVVGLANQIAEMTATSDEEHGVKARAHSFLAGRSVD
ncbi:hypothetical protein [Rhizobium rhizogenes]|uniref:hypothetical protein n=1 Tax=Rhizobium rhizogenes TaxID=359 RepID=UPI0015727EB6|nr:hypothetical protein [Rhizobium rhizogenes]NTI35564.1 hypothetical protein [Rhizobium rhizogenes]WEO63538.1 hypothetical protein G6L54_010550 [Rhizobium rhizogenes]